MTSETHNCRHSHLLNLEPRNELSELHMKAIPELQELITCGDKLRGAGISTPGSLRAIM
jgi:hypothetical protein